MSCNGISHIDIGLCPGQICTGESRAFAAGCFVNLPAPIITDENGAPYPPCTNSTSNCFVDPVPLHTANGQTCGVRIHFEPAIDRGRARTFCVSYVGQWAVKPVPFRIAAEAGEVAEDACLVLGLEQHPAEVPDPAPEGS